MEERFGEKERRRKDTHTHRLCHSRHMQVPAHPNISVLTWRFDRMSSPLSRTTTFPPVCSLSPSRLQISHSSSLGGRPMLEQNRVT